MARATATRRHCSATDANPTTSGTNNNPSWLRCGFASHQRQYMSCHVMSCTLLTAPGDLVRYAVGAVDPASCTDERFPGPNSGGTNFCAEQVELW